MKFNSKLLVFIFPIVFLIVPLFVFAQYDYTPMEPLPVASSNATPTDFYDYALTLYRFSIGAVGVCAVLMIIIGGFMYITSAGNNASMEKAKEIIADAVIGVLLMFLSYLLLYLINPDLVQIKKLPKVGTSSASGSGGGGATWNPDGSSPQSVKCPADENNAGKQKLADMGISTKKNCADGQKVGCVNTCGINDSAYEKLSELQKACGSGGKIMVTAGTENHINDNGKNTFDIRCENNDSTCNNNLAACVKSTFPNARQICSYDDAYRKNCSASDFQEQQGLTHIDFGA